MRTSTIVCFMFLAFQAAAALGACDPVRLAYVDQHRPPYYLGTGNKPASPPGASVDLLNEIVASVGCTVSVSRLPYLRVRTALEANLIDAAPLAAEGQDSEQFAFPLDKSGKPDTTKAMRMHTFLFMRASDKVAADGDPLQLLAGKRIGVVHGAAITRPLRELGLQVDDGAANAHRNVEKLMLGRIDVFAISLITPTDVDALVAARYGKEIVRIDKPAQTMHMWLAFSKPYYAQHRERVEAMWRWVGNNGNTRFGELLRKYDKAQ